MAEPTPDPPLNYEASAAPTHRQISTRLPPEVVTCLENARFLHLATITNPTPDSPALPHVSLMNYTFLPGDHLADANRPLPLHPTIIMTTNPQSLKTQNLLQNPRVSILVHDWVSHRPPTVAGTAGGRSGSPPASAVRSSLASLLLNMNTSAMSSISTTITGEARFLDRGSAEEKWCKEIHLANNTFGAAERREGAQQQGVRHINGLSIRDSAAAATAVDPKRTENDESGNNCFIAGEDVRVVVVRVKEGRIADWKGGVKDWVVVDNEDDVNVDDDVLERGESLRWQEEDR